MDTPIIQNKNNKYRAKCYKFITKYQTLIEAAIMNEPPNIEPLFPIKKGEFKKLAELLAKNFDYELFKRLKKDVKTNKSVDKMNEYDKERLIFYYMLTQKEKGKVIVSEKKGKNAFYSKKVGIPSCEYWNKILLQSSFTKDNFNVFVGNLYDLVNEQCKVNEAPSEVHINFYDDDEVKGNGGVGKIFIESETFLEVIELSQFFLGDASLKYLNEQKLFAYQRSFSDSISTFLRLRFGKFLMYQILDLLRVQYVLFTGGITLFSYGLRPSRDVDYVVYNNLSLNINKKLDKIIENMEPCFMDISYMTLEDEEEKKYPIRKYLFDVNSSLYSFGIKILTNIEDSVKTRYRRFSSIKSKKALSDYIFLLYTYNIDFHLPKGAEQYKNQIYPVLQRRYKITKEEERKIKNFVKELKQI